MPSFLSLCDTAPLLIHGALVPVLSLAPLVLVLALAFLVVLLGLALVSSLVLRVAAAVVVGVGLFTSFCYAALLIDWVGARRRAQGAGRLAPGLPPALWRAILQEFAVSVLMVLLWPVGLVRRGLQSWGGAQEPAPDQAVEVPATDPAEPPPPGEAPARVLGERRPVLLLHGYGMNNMTWAWLGQALRRRGLGPLYALTYFSPQAIEQSAEQLARAVDDILKREGATCLDIVAHSLGGLVSRYYIERLGGRVKNLVTLGTPHQGTILSRFGFGPVAAQLGRGATLLERPVRPPSGVRYLSIYSTADQLVIPWDSARLGEDGGQADPGCAELCLHGLGHLSLLAAPQVAEYAAEALRRAETAAAA